MNLRDFWKDKLSGWLGGAVALAVFALVTLGYLFLAIGTVVLWQQAVLPPEDVRMNELLAETSFFAWVKHWVLMAFWLALYGLAIFSACWAIPTFWLWVDRRLMRQSNDL